MNIVEYRAMVAEQQAQSEPTTDSAQAEQPANQEVSTETQTTTAEPQVDSQQTETTPPAPQTYIVEGIGEVPIDELAKGYLRQSDYTRKTQELAKLRQEAALAQDVYKSISSKPEIAQELVDKYGIPIPNPEEARVIEITNKYHDLLLEREIEHLQAKYKDFDTQAVLNFAYENKYENLEDAYLLYKSKTAPVIAPSEPIDVASLTEQIRQQVLAELKSEVDTQSIIQTGGDSQTVSKNAPTITQAELKVAKNMKMTPEDYIKWRDGIK